MLEELEGRYTTMTELGRETRKCDRRLPRSEKMEISVQLLDVRDEWRGKLYVYYGMNSGRISKIVRLPYIQYGIVSCHAVPVPCHIPIYHHYSKISLVCENFTLLNFIIKYQ